MYDFIIEFNDPIYTALISLITLTTLLAGCYKKLVSKRTRLNQKIAIQNAIYKLKSLNLNVLINNTFIKIDRFIDHFFGKPEKISLKERIFWRKEIFYIFILLGFIPNLIYGYMYKQLMVFLLGPVLIFSRYYSGTYMEDTNSYKDGLDFYMFIFSSLITFVLYSILIIFKLFPGEFRKVGIASQLIVALAVSYSGYCLLAVYCFAETRIFIKKIINSTITEVVLNIIAFIFKSIFLSLALLLTIFSMSGAIKQRILLANSGSYFYFPMTYVLVSFAIPYLSFIFLTLLFVYLVIMKFLIIPIKTISEYLFEFSIKKNILIYIISLFIICIIKYIINLF